MRARKQYRMRKSSGQEVDRKERSSKNCTQRSPLFQPRGCAHQTSEFQCNPDVGAVAWGRHRVMTENKHRSSRLQHVRTCGKEIRFARRCGHSQRADSRPLKQPQALDSNQRTGGCGSVHCRGYFLRRCKHRDGTHAQGLRRSVYVHEHSYHPCRSRLDYPFTTRKEPNRDS